MNVHDSLDVSGLLALRKHLSIVHHLPGRLRLRLGPALWGKTSSMDQGLLNRLLESLDGIRDVRVNKAIASVVIEYDPQIVLPDDWDTLVQGDAAAAGDVLKHWLARYGRLIRNTLNEKE